MLVATGETLALSFGVASSPVPVALLTLPTGEQRNRAPALLLGWILPILLMELVVVLAPGLELLSGASSHVYVTASD